MIERWRHCSSGHETSCTVSHGILAAEIAAHLNGDLQDWCPYMPLARDKSYCFVDGKEQDLHGAALLTPEWNQAELVQGAMHKAMQAGNSFEQCYSKVPGCNTMLQLRCVRQQQASRKCSA